MPPAGTHLADNFAEPAKIEIEGNGPGLPSQSGPFLFWGGVKIEGKRPVVINLKSDAYEPSSIVSMRSATS